MGKKAVGPPWLTRRCPQCGLRTVRVIDGKVSRMWRRRTKRCLNCGARALTLEVPATAAHKALIREVSESGGYQTSLLHRTHRVSLGGRKSAGSTR